MGFYKVDQLQKRNNKDVSDSKYKQELQVIYIARLITISI